MGGQMSVKKTAKPKFTVQVRATLILDVEVEGGTLPESIELAKTWKRADLLSLDDAVSVSDEKFETVGAWSDRSFTVEA
jgi:hypothetical protein